MIAFANDSRPKGVVTQERKFYAAIIWVQKWCKENSMELNFSKCGLIHFGFCNPIHKYYLNRFEIPLASQYKDRKIFGANSVPL